MSWSAQQEQALAAVRLWLGDPNAPQVFRLFGFAGTGKTTIAKEVQSMTAGRVLYATFTGKASLVLRSKGCPNASTIHSLIYRPTEDEHGVTTFERNHESELLLAAVLVVDEVSMVGPDIGRDLESFGVKILVIGDPAQLPPISGAGYFTNTEPDFMLREIHRQAAGSSIIRLSVMAREHERIPYGRYGDSEVIGRGERPKEALLEADQVLCGLNRTRRALNNRIRAMKGFSEVGGAMTGEKLVCLRNNRERGLLNGGLWSVIKSERLPSEGLLKMIVKPESGAAVVVHVPEEFFNGTEDTLTKSKRRSHDEFTYGYALTVHKAQGSQWDRVIAYDESEAFREHSARWLYTAITRAAERLTVVR